MNLELIIERLNYLINKAIKNNEVPIAAVIVKDNKIIGEGYNKINKENNILNHAEIIAIKKASKKLKNWRLEDCDIYITLEPCSMCKEIIKKSRIKNVYYFVQQNKETTEKKPSYDFLNYNTNFSIILRSFFESKR